MSGAHVIAQAPNVPWECSEYTGEAQTRCMHVLLELQQNHIAKLEARLNAQERTVNDLKEKVDRQEAFASRDARVYKQVPRYPLTSYASPYAYAPLRPLGIYLQPPGPFHDIMGLVRDIGDSQACHLISDMAEAIGIDIRMSRHFLYVSGACVVSEWVVFAQSFIHLTVPSAHCEWWHFPIYIMG